MSITIKLDPKTEAVLVTESAERGLSPESYAGEFVQRSLPLPHALPNYIHDPKERAKAFRKWAESHHYDAPPLSDEAIQRKNLIRETEWDS